MKFILATAPATSPGGPSVEWVLADSKAALGYGVVRTRAQRTATRWYNLIAVLRCLGKEYYGCAWTSKKDVPNFSVGLTLSLERAIETAGLKTASLDPDEAGLKRSVRTEIWNAVVVPGTEPHEAITNPDWSKTFCNRMASLGYDANEAGPVDQLRTPVVVTSRGEVFEI